MPKFVYSLVRCVPEPRTGEFINIGAIAGNAETYDWAIRQVSNEGRARKLANAKTLGAVHEFLARAGDVIDAQSSLDPELFDQVIDDGWLDQLHHDYRNVVQVSAPALVVAEDAEKALDLVFSRLLVDPVQHHSGSVTRQRVFGDLSRAYKHEIPEHFIRPRVELFVGDRLHAPIDFAIGNGHAVQLAQTWSFQRASIDEVATQVKAWGYTMSRLRDGHMARIVGNDDRVSQVSGVDVDLEVVVAKPQSKQQAYVYEEASEIFQGLGATIRQYGEVEQVSMRARELLGDDAQRVLS